MIETFLTDVYEPGSKDDKYTYINGSVADGATVYGDGKWLYSFHATDPASRTLCNSFDLLRIHKFGHLDEEAKPETPAHKLPSYLRAIEFALEDKTVRLEYEKQKLDKVREEFGQPVDQKKDEDISWASKLKRSSDGKLLKSACNVLLLLENDENLKDKMIFDRFTGRFLVRGKLPWDYHSKRAERMWDDEDTACLRNYLDNTQDFKGPSLIQDALCELKKKNSINVVTEYFESLTWDGVPRLDTLFIDYLGAADNEYSRAVARKIFVAAATRAVEERPIKFDCMVIFTGQTGIGKSTLIKKLGRKWYTDSIQSLEGKDTMQLFQNNLIIEFGELTVFNKAEINFLKQIVSSESDMYRAPYDREPKEHPRHCVFFGTTNEANFLRDRTGNRRYWPVECLAIKPTKSPFDDLTDYEIDQIWAEAYQIYLRGDEKLYLTGALEEYANKIQEAHREVSPMEGIIYEFIQKKVTKNWLKMSIPARIAFSEETSEEQMLERDRICAAEIWCECQKKDISTMRLQDTREINSILASLKIPGKRLEPAFIRAGADYGKQRGFNIKTVNDVHTCD